MSSDILETKLKQVETEEGGLVDRTSEDTRLTLESSVTEPTKGGRPDAASADGQRRVWVESVRPEVDGGRWPAKAILGDSFLVEADLVADGHDLVTGVVRYRFGSSGPWKEVALERAGNDRFRASFELSKLGLWQFTVEAWIDDFQTWQQGLRKKAKAGQAVDVDLLTGSEMLAEAAGRAGAAAGEELRGLCETLRSEEADLATRIDEALGSRITELMSAHPDRSRATGYGRILEVRADRSKARFSAWYEVFPRSCGSGKEHGTFRDLEEMLPYIASMQFDVLYLPPIHPIGTTHRKGRNNATVAGPEDPGSPWAIGNRDGGHKSVHPSLGTLEDFRRLVSRAEDHGMEVALDIAFQASPDHPYVKRRPEWFKQRPDGTIQFAENPPKKYEDIYPFDFESDAWKELWHELHSIFVFWIEQGVRCFRVDNPHTKPLAFWSWCLRDLQERYPEVLFVAEAFTRPRLMYALAKAGFSQSYTYFTWRNLSSELRHYMQELTTSPVRDFFRPNFWPNTPDILPEHLQFGGRPAFVARFVLSATLSSNYGIYGPAFELLQHVARPGSEEYLDNEKYEIKDWDLKDPDSLAPIITRINRARREHPAFQDNANLCFHPSDNDRILCFSKQTDDQKSRVLVAVNLDFHHTQSGWIDLDLEFLGLDRKANFQVHDLLSDARYLWRGSRNYIELNPQVMPAQVFAIRSFVRSEQDFEYYA